MPFSSPSKALASLPYFKGLSESVQSNVAAIAHVRTLSAGQLLFQEQDAATAFYIVLSGKVRIYKANLEGKEMTLHLFGVGEVFAEVPVFQHWSVYPASCMAEEESVVLGIDSAGFHALLQQTPEVCLSMLSVFAQRLHEFSTIIEDLTLRSVDARLAKYLVSLLQASSSGFAEPQWVLLPLSKRALASMLATVPETLSRCFKKLQQQEILAVQDERLFIKNPKALVELAQLPWKPLRG